MSDHNGNGVNNRHRSPAPLVTVITACHNTEGYIRQCVQSVKETVTCGKFTVEHICCDDGSTDNTLESLRHLSRTQCVTDSYAGLRVIGLLHNTKKPSVVRNEAIKSATGKYIFCLDDDDVLIQNSLRYMLNYLEGNPGSRWVYGDFLRVGKDLQYKPGRDYYGWPHATPQELLHSVFRGDHFYQHSLLFERSLFNEVGGYDPIIRMGEDLDLCVRFVMSGHMPTHLPTNTHLHRDHGNNMTSHFGREEHMEDIKNHYTKHQRELRYWLSSSQIADIEKELGIIGSVEYSKSCDILSPVGSSVAS